ncbi:hypothetical protein M3Y97_00656200 [Aphelenchoides bicaudatus]|nr:hypothetical protein M3Y97_00656200 [Aphelenchoides bicaudatus]
MGSRPLLLMSNRLEMRQFDLTAKRYHTLASNLSSDAVLDYWHKNQTLFWSDSTNGQIIACKSLRMEDGMLNNLGVCVREGSSGNEKQPNRARFHGIAVDWIHGLAFWTEINPNPSINVYDLSNNYARVIIDTQMDQPKQIVVDPMKGLIFWADLASDSRIERAGMNGQDRLTILKEPQLKRPTALTIDVLQQRLYWADSKLKSIMSADYYGQNIKTILHAHSIIRFPYSMVVFENQIFYSDRDQANILSMNRFDGSDIQILFTRLPGPTSLRIYHEQLQPDQRNLCANLTCSQLCLPMAMLRATLPEKEKNNEVPAFMCLCTAGQKPDPKDPKKCIQAERTVEDLYVETSDLKRRRGFFSTLSIFVMIVMVIGAAYYWYTHRWRPVNSNGFQQFINPAFES